MWRKEYNDNSEYSRQSIPSTPAVTRKVRAHTQKFHNQHRRPGHDGAGYPDFRISSDDSDNEHRIIVNQKSKSLAGGETGLPSRQMGSEPGWNQVKIARFFSMLILKSFLSVT